MKLDFHVHGLLTKKSEFDEKLFLQGIEIAKEQGLDGYILCEHFNAKNIYQVHEYLEKNYNYLGDRYIVNDFYIFVGMEVDIKNGGHVIVSGNRKDVFEIRQYLDQYCVKPNFIEFEKLINIAQERNCLLVGSHPYRESHKLHLQPKELLKQLHGLDLNATDLFSKGREETVREVIMLSEEIGVPYVTGSDSHYPIQLGSVKTSFDCKFSTVREIIEAIKEGRFKVEISPSLDMKVFSAKITKKHLKEEIKLSMSVQN